MSPPAVSPATRMVVLIAVALLIPNEHNPRNLDHLTAAEKGDLLALGTSMIQDGQKQPIRVFPRGDRYVLVSGHRRYLAARLVNLPALAAVVLDREPTRAELLVDQLIENEQRQSLSEIDKCEAYQTLLRENRWTFKQLAQAVHLSESQVTKTLTLKRLCPELQSAVRSGQLKASLAYHIARVGNPDKQKELAAADLTRDALEVAVRQALKGAAADRAPKTAAIGTVLDKTPAGLEALKTWAKELAAEVERLTRLNLDPAVVADTVARKFGKEKK
ncbi:MAG: ParB/RepB/Spo0J family partition protein [Gemmataceae bacterium]|nr:ParB/RepB/Spo0J family partition protein [Gemmataceae bacterium]